MNFLEFAKQRFSCRSFSEKKVEKEKLQMLIEAARIAPSGNNFQPWYFYVVSEDRDLLDKVHQTYHREWFKNSPAVIVACADYSKGWVRQEDGKNHAEIDVSIAIDHITLEATSLGLATCWVCHFDVPSIRKIFDLPRDMEPVALIPVGYCNKEADVNRFDRKRKSIDLISRFL